MRLLGRFRPAPRSGPTHVPAPPPRSPRLRAPAVDLAGVTPHGAPIEVTVSDTAAVLLFLTSSCSGCRPLWEGLPSLGAPGQAVPVVVVTPSPTTEDARAVAALADPARAEVAVVMSSEGWHAYGVTSAPWCVVVVDGVLVHDAPAPPVSKDVTALSAGLGRSSFDVRP